MDRRVSVPVVTVASAISAGVIYVLLADRLPDPYPLVAATAVTVSVSHFFEVVPEYVREASWNRLVTDAALAAVVALLVSVPLVYGVHRLTAATVVAVAIAGGVGSGTGVIVQRRRAPDSIR